MPFKTVFVAVVLGTALVVAAMLVNGRRPRVEVEAVLQATNQKVQGIVGVMDGLRADGLVPAKPFATPLQFEEFNAWHYYGRTAKHGAFMGGADFVQWHGNYELVRLRAVIDEAAQALRAKHGAR